ncbi:acyl-CoA dehydrogenase family protein [Rhodococcus sp. NPDC127528]|uniref:acyl-CoA dehydrogenase family protein n=1 Tax=unclassified Rhodococcus (in: high G+C Gram-positive bacteria) TaxID=192944 RepID=UPI003636A358
MNLQFSSDELEFRSQMRTFFTTEIPAEIRERARLAVTIDERDRVATQRILNAHGLAVPHWPVEWGGRDWSPVQRHIWLDEMQLATVPEPMPANTAMVGPVIASFGSQEQKERFLPATANIDIYWCQGFSEPDAGSDLASLKTRAVREGDHYIVNGQKTWTSLAQHADWIFCLVRTDPNTAKPQAGISFLLIDLSTPGITVRPIELISGGAEVNEVFFEDVRVPVENLVGAENSGWTYAKFLLEHERTGVTRAGATKVRVARAKEYAARIEVDGGTLLDDPLFAARIADLENEVLALELTQLRVVTGRERGGSVPSLLKLRGSELQQEATELLMDVAGFDSLPTGAPAGVASEVWAQRSAQNYLNYRKVSIFGGANEVQRTLIASSALGL